MNLLALGRELRKTGRLNGRPLKMAGQRRDDRMPGGWIADRVALQKSILLCWQHQPKFDHKRHGYLIWGRGRWVNGECDACKEPGNHVLYLSEEQDLLRTRR